VQRSTLFARRFDPAGAAVGGAAVTVADDVGIEPIAGVAALAASAGTIAYRRGTVGPRRQFIWFDRRGQALARVGVPEERGPAYGSISPDGRRLAVQRSTDGNTDIWLVDLERGPSVRFTSQPGGDISPVWSPGGDRIAYAAQVDGVFELFEKSEDDPTPRPLLRTGQQKQVTDWSRDGRYLLYRTVTTTPQPDTDIWALPLEGDRTPFPVVRTAFEERDGQFSPDESWLAYQSNDSGRHEIYVQPFKRPGERLRISTDGGVQVRWRGDGRELFYLTPHGHLMAVSISADPGGRLLRVGAPVPLFRTRLGAVQGVALPSYLAAPDGQRFLLDTLVDQEPPPIALILGWRRPGT
jgi:dipeptidyl aminopeptidase/acylaminoacyl peptidase